MSEATITFTELMNELDKYKEGGYSKGGRTLTDEQKQFIIKARSSGMMVAYADMSILWTKAGWGRMNRSTMADITKKVLEEHNGKDN